MSINSNYCKAALFSYFRFGKQVKCIASECGRYNSDILLVHKNKLVEVEIKTSKQDFKNDFKKYKHKFYNTSTEVLYKELNLQQYEKYRGKKNGGVHYKIHSFRSDCAFRPFQFYFAVPDNISGWALTYLNKHYPQYGLMVIKDSSTSKYARLQWQQRVKILKRAKKLHNETADAYSKLTIFSRMASELANMWQKRIK